jgi:hypothetical protein
MLTYGGCVVQGRPKIFILILVETKLAFFVMTEDKLDSLQVSGLNSSENGRSALLGLM